MNLSSKCVKIQEETLAQDFERIEKEGTMPSSDNFPGVYCSIGRSACGDLNNERRCLCPGCAVYLENDLKSFKYCLEGSSEEVG